MLSTISNISQKHREILGILLLIPKDKFSKDEFFELFNDIDKSEKYYFNQYAIVKFFLAKNVYKKIQLTKALNRFVDFNLLYKKGDVYYFNTTLKKQLSDSFEYKIERVNFVIIFLKKYFKDEFSLALPKAEYYMRMTDNLTKHLKIGNASLRLLNFMISVRLRAVGNYHKAIEYSLKEIELCKQVSPEDYSSLINSYNILALTYQKIGEKEYSFRYQNMAVEIRERYLCSDVNWLATSYASIAATCRENKNYSEALKYLMKELELRLSHSCFSEIDLGYNYKNIALSHYHLKNFEKASEYIDKALMIFDKHYTIENIHLMSTLKLSEAIKKVNEKWKEYISIHIN